MQLRPKIIPSFLQHLPIMLVVRSLEDNGPDFYARQVGACLAFIYGSIEFLGPATVDPVNSADLLLDHAWIPLGVQENNDPTAFVQVQAFAPNKRLSNKDTGEAIGPVKCQLHHAARLRLGFAVHEAGVASLTVCVCPSYHCATLRCDFAQC
jgi:hypothetical protein